MTTFRKRLFLTTGILLLLVAFFSGSAEKASAQSTPGSYYNQSIDYPTSERILNFDSRIVINKDSTMLVTEDIYVSSTNSQIRHGIYRDFPTVYVNNFGFRSTVPFNIVSIKKDGVAEPYTTERIAAGTRIYIGNKNLTLTPGYYNYEITYTTGRQLGYFPDHDELYYNITGNFWNFPIDYVNATVILPDSFPARQLKVTGYTGKLNETGKDFNYQIKDEGGKTVVTFSSSKTLYSGEGLSVVVGWPKGYVAEPAFMQRVGYFILDNLGLLLSFAGMVFLFCVYLILWYLRGRDPKTGTIIPLYYPPDDVSPALARFLSRMGFDDKAVGANLLDLGVKGAITISEDHDKYTLQVKQSNIEKLGLTEDEAIIYSKLFSASELSGKSLSLNFNNVSVNFSEDGIVITKDGKETSLENLAPKEQSLVNRFAKDQKKQVIIGGSYNSKVASAVKLLKEKITKEYGARYLITNGKMLAAGIIFSLIILLAVLFSAFTDPETVMGGIITMLFMGIWEFFWGTTLYSLFGSWFKKLLGDTAGNFASAGCALIMIPIGVLVFFVPVFGIFGTDNAFPVILFVSAIILLIMNFVFARAIKVRTLAGRQLEDKLEGFKMFMLTAEKNRIKTLYPEFPNKLTVYEKFLPFAVAFNIEAQWADKFAEEITFAQQAEGVYHPSWYIGGSYTHFGTYAGSISSGISSSLRTSSTPPGSRSGFGGGGGGGSGGGGSGGGGGGGGGGGW